jgi:glutamate carboxypeptidase
VTIDSSTLLSFCQAELPWQLDTIESLARIESPSHDKAAVDRCGEDLARRLREIGGRVTRIANASAGDHLRAEFGPEPGAAVGARPDPGPDPGSGPEPGSVDPVDQVLILGHFDTVWDIGTLATMPVVRRDGRLYGPGTFDMKAGIGMAMLAVRALSTLAPSLPLRIVMLWTTDEEVGSTTSRALIEREARASRAVFVLEPSLPGGAVKTARKGVGEFILNVTGVSAHAGIDPSKGVSAIHELAALVAALEPLNDFARGTSVNVGVMSGGTRTNVIAERARAQVDVRVPTMDEAARVDEFIRALRVRSPRATLEISGGIDRPPLERTPAVVALYQAARTVADTLGYDLGEGATGGGSDGNFTAALGVPTLDGLGAIGDGAHAVHEHVDIESLSWRTALIAGSIARLADG